MNKEIKESIRSLWESGLRSEAKELYRIAKSMTEEERDLQERIFLNVLASLGVNNPRLFVDKAKGLVSFVYEDATLTGFPKFLEKFLLRLNNEGTKDYELDHIDRSDPMRVYIKM